MIGNCLVLNCGSSSIKAALFAPDGASVAHALIERIGAEPQAVFETDDVAVNLVPDGTDHETLLDWLLDQVEQRHGAPDVVGHRVVHGGLDFSDPVRIGPNEIAALERLVPMARSHQPHNLAGIRAASSRWPGCPQIACFDTAFHRTIPEVRQLFALPPELTAKGIRRYGFHGISYAWIARRLPAFTDVADGKVVVAHLGNGASLCAMRRRRSQATTMGFTPLDGLIMGNRPGTLDPGAVLYLFDELGMNVEQVRHLLFDLSGLLGVSHLSNDMRSLLASEEDDAKLAVDLFIERACREIAAMAAALRGIDALVFTGGIGENARPIRAGIARGCAWLGAALDPAANGSNVSLISTEDSGVEILVIPTDEEAMIARNCQELLG